MVLRQETVTYRQGIPTQPELLRVVLEVLSESITGESGSAQVAEFITGIESELNSQPVDQRKVQRTGSEPGSPFPGVNILIYSIVGEDQYMVHIREGKSRKMEQRVAEELGLPCAESAVQVEISLPVSDDHFRCDMAPVVDRLYGEQFKLVSPDLSIVTGTDTPSGVDVAQAVGALLPQLSQGRLDALPTMDQWYPEWKFEAGDLRARVSLQAGRTPTLHEGVMVHHYKVEGSVVTGDLLQGEDSNPEVPLLLVTFERIEPPNASYPQLLCTLELRARALQAARAFAKLSMS